MYSSKDFTKEEMIKYEMIQNNNKNYWTKMLTYFTHVYAMRKAYSEDRATERGFEIAANSTHISPPTIVRNASINLNRSGIIINIIPMQEDEETTDYHH